MHIHASVTLTSLNSCPIEKSHATYDSILMQYVVSFYSYSSWKKCSSDNMARIPCRYLCTSFIPILYTHILYSHQFILNTPVLLVK